MLPLRHARWWRVVSVLILVFSLIAAMSPAFWFFDNRDKALLWIQNADKWLHGLAFVVLSVWFSGIVEKRRYWLVALGLMLFGFLVEFCQLQVSYRTADWLDIMANTLGIIVGLTIAVAGLGGWGPRFEDWFSRRHSH
ncbi:MAG: VanZ family protein [Gammaproteobacteria bacterium]|nr:VanZ family protein [Gammaproteobacteria bacterium]